MPHYKAPDNSLHWLDDPAFIKMLPAGSVQITDEKADAIRAEANAPTQEQIISAVFSYVQTALDSEAQTHGYDSILSLCSYAGSSVAKFAAEGQAGARWRDDAWTTAHKFLENLNLGLVPAPATLQAARDAAAGVMPGMVWPIS